MSTAPAAHGNNNHPPNAMRLFLASVLVLIAAGTGFSIRTAILEDWGRQFGFTQTELGQISGFGLWPFCVGIILFSFFTDRWGYGPIMAITFTLHVLSGVVTLSASLMFEMFGRDAAFWCLSGGTALFMLANGTSEAVINPLTATLYPKERTHYLNILHAGWPGGLVLGAFLGYLLVGKVRWEISLGIYLVPMLLYGLLMVGQRFPISEARAHGVSVGTMLSQFASPILLFLLVLHACVGYVELGVDNWFQNITGRIFKDGGVGESSRNYASLLFTYSSALMFALRFFAGPIVHKISPLGLLFASACLGTTGLVLLSMAGVSFAVGGIVVATTIAATIYAVGKTFYWPTMLGVVSERFPKGGAIALGAMGGAGMLSAGLLGAPAIGFKQDYFTTQKLQSESKESYDRYCAKDENTFLFVFKVAGLDNSKLAVLDDDGKSLQERIETLKEAGRTDESLENLQAWWGNASKYSSIDKQPVAKSAVFGGREALLYTAFVPGFMALGYLLLILYFRSQGGYRHVHITEGGDAAPS